MPPPISSSQLKAQLIAAIDQRYHFHAAKDLRDYIFSNHLFHAPDPALVNFAYIFRQDLSDYLAQEEHLEALVDYFVLSTKRYTYRRNQFVNFIGAYEELLVGEYRRFLLQTRAALQSADTLEALAERFAQVLKQHHERLQLILSSYCVTYHPENELRENPLLNTVPCAEYSPQFQLHLLNLELSQLIAPILDIGCGASGTLVHFLRDEGYEAYGVDREVPPGTAFFQQNWFDFDYNGRSWGTIIAHQSLSTHFIYHHLHRSAVAARYGRLYIRILASLKPGGAFHYAPGLPFFEDHLEKIGRYRLAKSIILADHTLGIGEIFYATKCTKAGFGEQYPETGRESQ